MKRARKVWLGNLLVCPNCLRIRSPLHWILRRLGICDDYNW